MSRDDTYEHGSSEAKRAREQLEAWDNAESDDGRMNPAGQPGRRQVSKYDGMSDASVIEEFTRRAIVRKLLS